MPSLPLLLGVVLIGMNMPNVKREGKVKIDVPGIIALVITLCGILLALNFGTTMGWTNPIILTGFVIGIIALAVLIKIESKAEEPLIPLRLFKNRNYTVLLIVGFICYFYLNAMNVYAPIGALRVMKVSTTLAGTLQMPRTIVTILLPTIVGAWVGKKSGNAWKVYGSCNITCCNSNGCYGIHNTKHIHYCLSCRLLALQVLQRVSVLYQSHHLRRLLFCHGIWV